MNDSIAVTPLGAEDPDIESSASAVQRRRLFPVGLLAGFVVAYGVYDYISYYFPPSQAVAFAYAQLALIAFLALLNVRWGLYAFLVCLIFADEISRNLWEYTGDSGVISFLTVSAGGVALANLAALAVVGTAVVVVLLRFAERPTAPVFRVTDYAVLAILGIFALATLHGFRSALGNPRLAVNHLNLPIMLGGLYFAVRTFFSDEECAFDLWRVLILSTTAKITGWTGLALLGQGSMFGTTLRVGFGAVWTIYVFVLLFGVIIVVHGKGNHLSDRVISAALVVMAGALLLMSAGRMLWLLSAFGFLVLVIVDRMQSKILLMIFGTICAAGIVYFVAFLGESMFETIGSMASTLKFWESESVTTYHSNLVRAYEFRNIHAQLVEHNNLLLGEGPGSTFTDRYHPFPFGLSEGDYPVAEQEVRRFRNSHSLFTQLMLQVGYLGLLVYILCFVLVYAELYLAYRRLAIPHLKFVALALLCFLPSMVYMSWNSKANMLLGVIVGGTGVLVAVARRRSPARAIPEGAHAEG